METKYQFAKTIVQEAGEFLREHLHDCLTIQEKSHFTDLVTQLDKQTEDDLREKILSHYPSDQILGEEGEECVSVSSGNVWVIDPIDGTANFIAQREDFTVILAYFEEGVGQFAFIYDVMKDELLHGGGDFPVCLNGQVLPSFQDKPLKEGLFAINAGLYAENVSGLADLVNHMLGSRAYGSAGIAFSRVFKGQLLGLSANLCPWDYAAASIFAPQLGYHLITLDGKKPNFTTREMVIILPLGKEEEMRAYLK